MYRLVISWNIKTNNKNRALSYHKHWRNLITKQKGKLLEYCSRLWNKNFLVKVIWENIHFYWRTRTNYVYASTTKTIRIIFIFSSYLVMWYPLVYDVIFTSRHKNNRLIVFYLTVEPIIMMKVINSFGILSINAALNFHKDFRDYVYEFKLRKTFVLKLKDTIHKFAPKVFFINTNFTRKSYYRYLDYDTCNVLQLV